ncbi:Rhs element Vgr protein, partial [Formivibrio citricus]
MPPLSLPDFASLFQQSARLLTLRLEGLEGETLLPHTLQGEEGVSKLYRYGLVCLSPDAGLELKALLGRPARLGILSADGTERVICGLVTAAEYLGSDGGFARYGLTIEPALALLALRRTSRVFQDLSVPDIVQQILEEHQADNPAFTSTFQFSAETRLSYTPRSYCLQYRESDLDFITRLLAEEGISYTFRFDDSGETPIHTLVLFDDVWSLPACPQAAVRFHRNDATEQADGVTAWQSVRRLQSGRTSLASFDYQPVSTVQAGAAHLQNHGEQGNAALSTLEDYDPQSLYFGRDEEDLTRYARLRQQAHDLAAKTFTGVGAVRQLGAGQWFRLDEHPAHAGDLADAREFIVLSQTLKARNNLPDELNRQRAAGSSFAGSSSSASSVFPSPSSLFSSSATAESTPLFENRFTAVRRGVAVVPGVSAEARDSTVAGNGDFAGNGLMPLAVPFRAKPTALGIQTATVVGPAEEEIHTDSQGRIKVQFHWQRPSEHPEFGANLDDKSSCWLRVAYPSAGVAWGQQFIPRIGQEVLVDFIEGDIDRPVVVGVLYNGSHPTPDFSGAGKLPANKTLSGIKSKEYKGSQYNELLLDDSTGEVRTKLSSEHAKTQLNQGYLIHPRTEGKGEPRGEGFELRTDKHGALRAAHGILLSTEAQNGASGKQLDRVQAQSQLDSAFTLAQSLAEVATHQQADTAETGQDDQTVQSDNSAGPKTKQGHLHHLQHALKSWEAGSNTDK